MIDYDYEKNVRPYITTDTPDMIDRHMRACIAEVKHATLKIALNKASDDLGDAMMSPADDLTIAAAGVIKHEIFCARKRIAAIRRILSDMA